MTRPIIAWFTSTRGVYQHKVTTVRMSNKNVNQQPHPTYVILQYRVKGDRDLCNINYINKIIKIIEKVQESADIGNQN